ncbi:MAG: N-acetyl-D-Glu racemase DgcA [Pseudomonadota bacterium]
MDLQIDTVTTPLRAPFAISREVRTEARTVLVSLTADGKVGRGECVPYGRYGETVESVIGQIEGVRDALAAGITREASQDAMPPGAARCAVDGALWDLQAKQQGVPVWTLAGLPEPQPIETAMTIGLDTPEAMLAAAQTCPGKLLKLKLGGAGDIDRIAAVHKAVPDVRFIVDGNEAMEPDTFPELAEQAAKFGVALIEQPFPAGDDDPLLEYSGPVPVCADESAHTSSDVEELSKRYGVVNIKLDKTGGLTEALAMQKAAREAGMGVMVGCMVAGSISMAPAVLLGQVADFVDVDGPTWLANDVEDGLCFEDGRVYPPVSALWG